MKKMPPFNYELTGYASPFFLWIFVELTKLHKVPNLGSFYALFGYSEEEHKNGIDLASP